MLDPTVISRNALKAFSLAHWPQSVDNFEDIALDWLATQDIGWERRRNLLSRLRRPDVPKLAELVVADLNQEYSGGFGSFEIHRLLTLAQLDDVVKLKPDLLNQSNYVNAYLAKLQPNDDENWRRNPAQTRAYLDRLLAFTRRLAPVHNSLKAHALYNRLALDLTTGTFDKALFLEYLQLPRRQGYMAKALLESANSERFPVDLNANFTPMTQLPIIGGDEALVRTYLKQFLLDAASPKEFEPFINDIYLKQLFAEVKIENGLGEPEQWASMLSPELFRQLKDRIDIDLRRRTRRRSPQTTRLRSSLSIKNVPTLMVKVFEVNTTNFYRTQKREVDTAINLDGLIPNSEKTYTYTDTAFRRVGRKFEFPQLTKPASTSSTSLAPARAAAPSFAKVDFVPWSPSARPARKSRSSTMPIALSSEPAFGWAARNTPPTRMARSSSPLARTPADRQSSSPKGISAASITWSIRPKPTA